MFILFSQLTVYYFIKKCKDLNEINCYNISIGKRLLGNGGNK